MSSRTIDIRHQQFFDERVNHLVTCYRLTLKNGTIYRFTDHDRKINIRVGNEKTWTTFVPSGGFDSSAVEWKTQLEKSNTEFAGAISSDYVTDDDLRAGLYDGAKVERFKCDRRFPFGGVVFSDVFFIEEVTHTGEVWTASVSGLGVFLDQTRGTPIERQCRYRLGQGFGDSTVSGCKVDLDSYTEHDEAVTAVDSTRPRERFQISTGQSAGYYDYGTVLFQVGNNTGLEVEIESHESGGWINLNEPMPYDITTSDIIDITAGCDWTFGTCDTKFSNTANFGGFPYIVGEDAYKKGPR